MVTFGRSDKTPSVGLIGGPTGCYTPACSACWLGYDHSQAHHTESIKRHQADADEYSIRPHWAANPGRYQAHRTDCSCGYIPTGERV